MMVKHITATFMLSGIDDYNTFELSLNKDGTIEDGWYDAIYDDPKADEWARKILDKLIPKANKQIKKGILDAQPSDQEWDIELCSADKSFKNWSISGSIEAYQIDDLQD